jgi:hypothetical protein
VWDIKNGTILKLTGPNRLITHAIHGFQKLSFGDLCTIYGNPPLFKDKLSWPESTRNLEVPDKAHWLFLDSLESSLIPVICHITSNPTLQVSPIKFAFHLLELYLSLFQTDSPLFKQI